MSLPLPATLSPSKVSSFQQCALAFRLSAIDQLPEPTSLAMTRGTLVHAALERLYTLPAPERTLAAALDCLTRALDGGAVSEDLAELDLDDEDMTILLQTSEDLVRKLFEIEDPTAVDPVGLELKVSMEFGPPRPDGSMTLLRGIIDRLERDDSGRLIVVDYKTGRVPREDEEQKRMVGVHIYALLCEALYGERPHEVRLLYIAEPVAISVTPTEQSVRALERKLGALWAAITSACEREDFRPRRSRLCDFCSFKAHCPAFQ